MLSAPRTAELLKRLLQLRNPGFIVLASGGRVGSVVPALPFGGGLVSWLERHGSCGCCRGRRSPNVECPGLRKSAALLALLMFTWAQSHPFSASSVINLHILCLQLPSW